MAEAIGLAASLGGLISLGLSVCKGLMEYYSSYKSAGKDIQLLCEEVNNLIQVLQSFEDAMKDSDMRLKLEASASGPIEACRARITELNNELEKFTNAGEGRRRSVRKFMSKSVRALYPFKEETLRKLRENVSRANEMLQQAASSVLIRQNNKMFDTIDEFYQKEESKEIMRWLDPPSPSQNQAIASSKRGDETGSWFINSSEFSAWENTPYSVLWVYGGAGCGKTVLCSTIINHLIDHCQNQPTSGIAYFYFDYTNASASQDHSRLLRSLIEQLSAQHGSVPRPLKTLYERCRNGTTQPTEGELAQTLRNIIQLFSPCYLAIDAVDESKEKQQFLKLLNIVAGQWRLPQIHFLLTSRTELDTEIPKRNWGSVSVAIEDGVGADVKQHVLATLQDENGILSQWNPSERDMVAKSLITASQGNFRWVACQLQALSECHTIEELQEALSSLPATLEETYERALLAVEERRKEGFRHILRWLSFSARPLRLDEIAEVLAIDFGANPRPHYNPRRRFVNTAWFFHKHSNIVSVLSVKSKTEQHQELRLAHLSVRDYLLSKKIVGSPTSFFKVTNLSAHWSIAEACIVYLQQFATPEDLKEKSPEAHALARYAARFWSYHVQAATAAAANERSSGVLVSTSGGSAPLILLIIELLVQILRVFGLPLPVSQEISEKKDSPTDLNRLCVELLSAGLQNHIRFFDPDTPWIDKPDISRSISALPSSLYYAAHAGLTDSVRELLAQGLDVNAVGGRYGTALQAASCKGYRDVIELLLEKGANVNQFEGDYGYALQGACCYGHQECVALLLDRGADVNARGGEHYTALHAAAFNGYESVIKLLVERGATIDVPGAEDGRTPLIEAAAEGHTAAVELFLQLGADSLIRDSGGWTALDESAPPGFDAIVRILIEHNHAILESRDLGGNSALDHTAGQHHVSTVSLLLELGIDVNSRTREGRTALFKATGSGNKAIVDLLLRHGADVSVKDTKGWAALHVAAFYGQVEAGEALLEAGALIDDGPHGWTPLHVAVLRKHIDFVELLLEGGADTQAATLKDVTVMDCIDFHYNYQAEPLAMRLHIGINSLTLTGLRLAAIKGHDARIRGLLERGADINARDEGGLTALMWAALKGRTSTTRLLVQNGADVNARNDEGETVMDYFSGVDEDITKLLLDHGYKEEKKPEDYNTETEIPTLHPDREVLEEIRQLLIIKE